MKNSPGMNVARNVRRLRQSEGLALADLSARLSEAGRPLSLNVLSKIEREDRSVDVDDLVALAQALGVTPTSLLVPPSPISDSVWEATSAYIAAWRAVALAEAELDRLRAQLSGAIDDLRTAVAGDEDVLRAVQEVALHLMGQDSQWDLRISEDLR